MKPDLSIIIVNWNTKDFLRDCLKSIYDKIGKNITYEIIVVDNASTDTSPDMIRTEFPMVKLLANKENVGFGRGCNQSVKLSKGEYILFLNPDSEIIATDFKKIWKYMARNKDVGIIVPLIFNKDGTLRHRYEKMAPTIKDVFNYYILRNRIKRISMPISITDIQKQDIASGCCFMMSKVLFKKIKGFDEKFFLFFEDVDLSLRITHKGFNIVSWPGFKIVHEGGKSTDQFNYLKYLSYHKSTVYFFKKYYGLKVYAAVKLLLVGGALIEVMALLTKSIIRPRTERYSNFLRDQFRILWWHITDTLQKT